MCRGHATQRIISVSSFQLFYKVIYRIEIYFVCTQFELQCRLNDKFLLCESFGFELELKILFRPRKLDLNFELVYFPPSYIHHIIIIAYDYQRGQCNYFLLICRNLLLKCDELWGQKSAARQIRLFGYCAHCTV